MREALRVLRDLYSARHYCRSFVPRVRISSPPPSPAYFHRLSLSPLSSSSLYHPSAPPPPSSFSFYYFPLSQHSSTQDYYVTGTMPANEDRGERLLIPYPPRYQNGWYDGTLFDYLIPFQHLFALSTLSSNHFIYTRNSPLVASLFYRVEKSCDRSLSNL